MGLGRTNAGSGAGGSGGILTVNSADAGTVTVANNILGKTYKKAVKAGGTVVFKGLATGTWTVTISDGEQSATQTVEIDADYEITVAYFSATITVTYPANSTCTCSQGATIFTDTNSTDAEKTVVFTVPNIGEWTILATNGDKTKDTKVEINADGQSESVAISYELILFDNGAYAEETGGFASVNGNYLYAKSIRQEGGIQSYTRWYTNNAIDLTNYNTLTFTLYSGQTGDLSENKSLYLKVGLTTAANKNSSTMVASYSVSNSVPGTYTIDISSIEGSYHITGHTDGGDWTSMQKTSYTNTSFLKLS